MRSADEIKDRVKAGTPILWRDYPYATAAYFLFGVFAAYFVPFVFSWVF